MIRTKIPSLLVQGETEPSHALLDKCQNIYDTGRSFGVGTEGPKLDDADHGSEIKL